MNERNLFIAALQVEDPAGRTAYLDKSCGGDAELRQRVEALLAAFGQAGSFLQKPAVATVATSDLPPVGPSLNIPPAEGPGTVIGPYKLLQQIGEGGMGTVFMAEQTHPVQRKVALKIIKAGMDSKQVIARFEAERQALALMDHPNIARVLDAGTIPGLQIADCGLRIEKSSEAALHLSEDSNPQSAIRNPQSEGRPYFVMELVKGVPITRYCDEHHLTPRERLELFVPVCQAVQHAHQKGIIHRDLKPSNVMVCLYDGKPVPKVIDFGIAKATGSQLTEKTLFTELGQVVGTLEYMSPEQAELNQLDIDTRSDIYSLGVLLYELLTGTTPLERKRFKEVAFLEVLRLIREEESPRPSTRLSTTDGLPSIAANRGLEPKKLSGLVRGELDWIVMKTLEKDRHRRYETANGFAQDLQRYLADEPVQACPPSALYRFRKFVRRNKGTVLAVSLVVLMLVGGIIGTTMGMWRANAESERATGAERKAKLEQFDARLAQARASRMSRQPGRRQAGWQALTEAAQLARELELGPERTMDLRNEAIACLALSDLQRLHEWPGNPPGTSEHPGFDADLKHYARCDSKGNISVRRVSDDRELARLPGQGTGAASLSHADTLSFSPDGALLAVHYERCLPGRPTNYLLWDWRRRTIVSQPSVILTCPPVFSPDGRLVALGQRDGTVIASEIAGGKEANRLKATSIPMNLAFHPDGTRLAVAVRGGSVQVWEMATGKVLYEVSVPGHPWCVAWHPQGVLLAVACQDKNVHLWDGATGRSHLVLRGHQGAVVGVTFAADGDLLVSTAWDGTSRLWNPWTGRELIQIQGEARHVSRDGRRVASRAGDTLTVWEVNPGLEYRTLPRSPGRDRDAGGGFSPDGRWLAVATSDEVQLWDLMTGKACAFLPKLIGQRAQFHPSGKELFTSGEAGLYRWPFKFQCDTLRIGPASKLPMPTSLTNMSLDGKGRTLAVVDGIRDGGCWLLDLKDPVNHVRQLKHSLAVTVATSPNGQWVAAGTHNGHGVKVWETADAKLVRHLLPENRSACVAFSPNGQWLLIATQSEISIWETGSWQRIRDIRREQHGINSSAAFSPGSPVLALTISSSAVQLVETATWRQLARLQSPDHHPVAVRGFSPDGTQLLVTTPGDVRLWDLRLIRARLQEIGLDWPQRPYPPPPLRAQGTPLRVEVDLGDLSGQPKE